MKNFLCVFFLFLSSYIGAAEDIIGFWKSIDEKTGTPQMMVAIYKHQEKFFGRIVAFYDDNGQVQENLNAPKKRAPEVRGAPFYCGLDFISNLQKKGAKYQEGKILDPKRGKEYNVKLWIDQGNLVVRGELLCFGRSQVWVPVSDTEFPSHFKKPDLTQFIPVIPQKKG